MGEGIKSSLSGLFLACIIVVTYRPSMEKLSEMGIMPILRIRKWESTVQSPACPLVRTCSSPNSVASEALSFILSLSLYLKVSSLKPAVFLVPHSHKIKPWNQKALPPSCYISKIVSVWTTIMFFSSSKILYTLFYSYLSPFLQLLPAPSLPLVYPLNSVIFF